MILKAFETLDEFANTHSAKKEGFLTREEAKKQYILKVYSNNVQNKPEIPYAKEIRLVCIIFHLAYVFRVLLAGPRLEH